MGLLTNLQIWWNNLTYASASNVSTIQFSNIPFWGTHGGIPFVVIFVLSLTSFILSYSLVQEITSKEGETGTIAQSGGRFKGARFKK